jgi:hypothetical protein
VPYETRKPSNGLASTPATPCPALIGQPTESACLSTSGACPPEDHTFSTLSAPFRPLSSALPPPISGHRRGPLCRSWSRHELPFPAVLRTGRSRAGRCRPIADISKKPGSLVPVIASTFGLGSTASVWSVATVRNDRRRNHTVFNSLECPADMSAGHRRSHTNRKSLSASALLLASVTMSSAS